MGMILIIEDDLKFRKMLHKMLASAGHEVFEAANGVEGLASMRKTPADLIITDIFMPDKEGIETIQELTREFKGVKIIAISGGGKDGTFRYLEFAKDLGAKEIFTKPFDMEEFLEAVERVLAGA